MEDMPRIEETARRQRGFITVPQLRALGVDGDATTAAQRRGRLTMVRRGLYALPPADETFVGRVVAACLHPSSPAASGLTAAHLWGLWHEPDIVEVTVRAPRKLRLSRVEAHRSADLRREHVTALDGTRVTTPARTLVDLGRVLPETEVPRVVHQALVSGLVDVARLTQIRIDVGERGRNGAGVLGRVLESLPANPAGHDSGPELTLHTTLVSAGLPDPVAQWPVQTDGATYFLDLAYPQALLALEYDGEDWHAAPDQRRRDAIRQRRCEAAGWTFIRVTKHDLKIGRPKLLSIVRQALASPAA